MKKSLRSRQEGLKARRKEKAKELFEQEKAFKVRVAQEAKPEDGVYKGVDKLFFLGGGLICMHFFLALDKAR